MGMMLRLCCADGVSMEVVVIMVGASKMHAHGLQSHKEHQQGRGARQFFSQSDAGDLHQTAELECSFQLLLPVVCALKCPGLPIHIVELIS